MFSFMVSLIHVKDTLNERGRKCLQSNCTHVCDDYWLFEGDEEFLENINFEIVAEAGIEAYGDMSGLEIKQMVFDSFGFDPCEKDGEIAKLKAEVNKAKEELAGERDAMRCSCGAGMQTWCPSCDSFESCGYCGSPVLLDDVCRMCKES